jgi:hypothetical protein
LKVIPVDLENITGVDNSPLSAKSRRPTLQINPIINSYALQLSPIGAKIEQMVG